MKARHLALDGAITIVAIVLRLSPLERDMLAASLFALHHKFRRGEKPKNDASGRHPNEVPIQHAAAIKIQSTSGSVQKNRSA